MRGTDWEIHPVLVVGSLTGGDMGNFNSFCCFVLARD